MRNRLKNGIAISLIPQIVLVKWLGNYPQLVESYYSKGFYPFWSGFFRKLLGWFPISIGDIIYGLLIIGLVYYLAKNAKQLIQKWKELLRDAVMVLAIAYFTFHLSWGLNYYREPIADSLKLEEEYNTKDLIKTAELLLAKTNELQFQLTSDTSAIVIIPHSQKEIFIKTLEGYDKLALQFPLFQYKNPSLKKSGFSTLLTYMGYGGYLNPFTHESQVNAKIPNFRFPVVCAHEVGHQLGYSAENEVNFIGYLVMASHEDKFLQYSAYSYALSHCLRELNKRNPDLYKSLYVELHDGVKKNFEELSNFWKAYDNPLEPVFKSIFNSYLKANNQAAGIKSYNLVVSLIIGYHEQYPIQVDLLESKSNLKTAF